MLPATRAIDLRQRSGGRADQARATRSAFEYSDCWVDDARLVVLNALDAQARGAEILHPHGAAVGARRDGDAWTVELERRAATAAPSRARRCIVNAAGPWVEQVLAGIDGVVEQPPRPPGQGQPYRHPQVLGRRPGLPAAEHRQARDLRQSLRGRPGADRHHRHPGRGQARGRRDRRPARSTTCSRVLGALLRSTADARRHRPQLLRRAAALRRQRREPLGGDARLRLRHRSEAAERRSAAAPVGLRRQDHDLSQAGGACARQAGARSSPAWPRPGPPRAPLPGGDMPEPISTAGSRPSASSSPGCPATLALHYGRLYGTRADALLEGARSLSDLGTHFGAKFYEREARFLLAHRMGARPRRTSSTAAPSTACI